MHDTLQYLTTYYRGLDKLPKGYLDKTCIVHLVLVSHILVVNGAIPFATFSKNKG